MEEYLLGIDAGTSHIKVVVFGLDGMELFVASRKNHTINKHEHWVEQDMGLLWINICEAVKEIIENNKINPSSILGIGITGQGEGCWLLDSTGKPVRKAILWSDGRAASLVKDIEKNNFIRHRIKEITGSFIFPGAASILLKWLKENEYESFRKAEYCCFCKDWIRFKLTGDINLDITDTSTSVLDLSKKAVSEEIMELLNIKECKDLFSNIIKPYESAGTLTEDAAKLTGLKEGTPVAVGMMDIAASAVGMGAVTEGDCCTILGTTCCNEVVKASYESSVHNYSGFECHAVDNLFLNVIASTAGTPNLDWIIDNFFTKEKKTAEKIGKSVYEILEKKIKDIPVGSGGVIYHPYISTSGERAPFFNPNARAQFFGISNKVDKYHLLHSVYEGVALSIKDCLQGMNDLGKIFLGGGGAKSYYWAQLISDCIGKEVIICEGNEFAAKGAALAAGTAVGVYKDIVEASKNTLRIKKHFMPDKNKGNIYENIYTLYKSIRESNEALWELRQNFIDSNYKNFIRGDFMENYIEEKKMVIEAGKDMLKRSWTVGTWGNISVRTKDKKYMVITPSGVDYEVITPEMMSLVSMDGELISGKKPSIETGLHLEIYKNRQDVNAVVHTHSVYTGAVASTRITVPPILDEMAQIIGGEVKTAEYALPGSKELAHNCKEALGDKMAVLLANHGGVSVGKDLKEAFKITSVLEISLKSYFIAKVIGNPVVLDDKDVNFMRDFFMNSYGK